MGIIGTIVGLALATLVVSFASVMIALMTGSKARKIHARVFEPRSNGKAHFIGKDVVTRKRIENGGYVWIGKKTKGVWLSPPNTFLTRVPSLFGIKDEADYIRHGRFHIPINKELESNSEETNVLREKVQRWLGLKQPPTEDLDNVDVLVPVASQYGEIELKIPSEDLSYQLSHTETVFQDFLKGNMEKWTPFLQFGGLAVLVVGFIIAVYFWTDNLGGQSAGAIGGLTASVNALAQSLGVGG